MSFRIYCAECKSKITPPYWNQYGMAWCHPDCARLYEAKRTEKEKVDEKKDVQCKKTTTEMPECNHGAW